MKKIYFEPEMELVELETVGFLATSDPLGDIDSGGSDGGISGSDSSYSDTTNPGWSEGL